MKRETHTHEHGPGHDIGRLEKDRVAQHRQDHEFSIRHRSGDLRIQARIAASVILAGEYETGMPNLTNPGRHFRLGIDVENAEEHLWVCIDHLLHAPFDHFRRAIRKLWGEPALFECREHRRDALGAHRSDDAPNLRTVVRRSEGCSTIQTERQHAVGVAPSERGPNHPAKRVTREMRLLDV